MKISKIIEKNKKAIGLVAIEKPPVNGQGQVSIRGTGFVVSSDGKFITCAHVYNQISENDRQYLGIMLPDKIDEKGVAHYKKYPVKLVSIDVENDTALMQITDGAPQFQAIDGFDDAEKVNEGDEVLILGYPLAIELMMMNFGVTMTASKCIISAVKRRGTDNSLHFFMVDTHINNGSSGSPVFSVDSGKVVAMASGKISSKIPLPDGKIADIPANMGICMPSKYAQNIINKNK
jgi:S1-C subfamily serine protease